MATGKLNPLTGQQVYKSGAAGRFSAPKRPASSTDDHYTLILIGQSTDGPSCLDTNLLPEERVIQGSWDEVKNILRGGNLFEAGFQASRPSSDIRYSSGPRYFKFLNTNANVAAKEDILSILAGNSLTVEAASPGPGGNLIRLQKNLAAKTIEVGDSFGLVKSSELNIVPMNVSYIGDATTAILAIDVVAKTFVITLAGQADGSASFSASMSSVKTVGDLVALLNSKQGYVAEALMPSWPLILLDEVEATEAVDTRAAVAASGVDITANFEAEKSFLENTGLVKVKLGTGVKRKPLGNMTVFTFLKGGSTGSSTSTEIKAAIDFSETVTGFHRVLCGGSVSDRSYFRDSVNKITENGVETVGGAGSLTTDVWATRLSDCRSIRSKYMVYGLDELTFIDSSGSETEFDPWMQAVVTLAMKAAQPPYETPTGKATNVRRVPARTEKQIREAVQAGGLTMARKPNNGAYYINLAITTTDSATEEDQELQFITTGLAMIKDFREMFDEIFRGEVIKDTNSLASGPREADLPSFVEGRLGAWVNAGYLRSSQLLGAAAFSEKFTAILDGTGISFKDIEGKVVNPVNFCFYALSLSYHRGTASVG